MKETAFFECKSVETGETIEYHLGDNILISDKKGSIHHARIQGIGTKYVEGKED